MDFFFVCDVEQDFDCEFIFDGFCKLFVELDCFIFCGNHEADGADKFAVSEFSAFF